MSATHKSMPEAEVTLRLACWLLDTAEGVRHVDLAIDGAHVFIKAHWNQGRWVEDRTVFPIEEFLAGECETSLDHGDWRQTFTRRNGSTLTIRSIPGFDVRAVVGGRTLLVECKGGPLETIAGRGLSAIFAEAIGQAIAADSSSDDEIWVAVPDSPGFENSGRSIAGKRAFRNTGIRIALVSQSGSVRMLN